MNPLLLSQIEQLFQWGISGVLAYQANKAANAAFLPSLTAALSENRPLTPEEWGPIHSRAQAAHDALANA
jgi:hypothetical protein